MSPYHQAVPRLEGDHPVNKELPGRCVNRITAGIFHKQRLCFAHRSTGAVMREWIGRSSDWQREGWRSLLEKLRKERMPPRSLKERSQQAGEQGSVAWQPGPRDRKRVRAWARGGVGEGANEEPWRAATGRERACFVLESSLVERQR